MRYLQLCEALGQPPTAKQFGSSRLAWPWSGGEAEGWPLFQHTLAALTNTSPPASEPAAGTAEAAAPSPLESTKHVLAKGANAPLRTESVAVRLITTGVPVDVSVVLPTRHGKVRSDHDLVFYNHPHHDGVRTTGDTVTAGLPHIPDDVHTVAVIASIGLEAQPTASFNQETTWHIEVTQPSGRELAFTPAPFVSGETVTIAMEIYRHASGWKARAVGQGYDTGLAGLAADDGINIEP
uniref:TerD family protein n=1 Tax=Streptomyces sp. NBC_00119 TaxID=2975659 RepID=A0AAU1TYZ5_9ACTN